MICRGVRGLISSRQEPFRRLLCSPASGSGDDANGKKPKEPGVKEVLGPDVLSAVDVVSNSIHAGDTEAKKRTRSALLSKLMQVEKATFENATESQSEQLLSDKNVLNLLQDVAADSQTKKPNRFVAQRFARRGLLLLRKEVFYQAKQDGYSAEDATRIAENAVTEAEQRLAAQRELNAVGAEKARIEHEQVDRDRSEKERKLYEYALQMAEKMLYKEDENGLLSAQKAVNPDPKIPSLFQTTNRLGIFANLEGYEERSLGFWRDWDLRAATIGNQSAGPENAIEEQIVWTRSGKQWPYPIDNEYLLGEEEKIPFFEHVFLERHLAKLGLPKDGPIAHFMELVCVGLSKNPYMSAAKKREHLEWFAKYFNAEKQKLIEKLHEQEVAAAAQV